MAVINSRIHAHSKKKKNIFKKYLGKDVLVVPGLLKKSLGSTWMKLDKEERSIIKDVYEP